MCSLYVLLSVIGIDCRDNSGKRNILGSGAQAPQHIEVGGGRNARRPVSRVLSWAESPRDGHSSGTPVAGRLARPTRAAGSETNLETALRPRPRRPYLVLLPEGFAMPPPLPGARCALTAPFHPCSPASRPWASGLLSVALSLGSPPPGVTRLRASVEPGLSSAARLRRRRRPSGRLARPDYAPTWGRSSVGPARGERAHPFEVGGRAAIDHAIDAVLAEVPLKGAHDGRGRWAEGAIDHKTVTDHA